ncbi:MAG: HPr kinase/phosphorylase [Candidatus Eiseniibacteriota bacterium]
MSQVHATCVEVEGMGVLLRGPSGSGKSDLALRLIDGGARLVADDRTDLAVEDGRLIATCPAALAGRLEVRGVGIGSVPSVARAVVGLVVDLVAADRVERLPDWAPCRIDGIAVPCLALAPFEASAPAKLRLAARWVQCSIMPPR